MLTGRLNFLLHLVSKLMYFVWHVHERNFNHSFSLKQWLLDKHRNCQVPFEVQFDKEVPFVVKKLQFGGFIARGENLICTLSYQSPAINYVENDHVQTSNTNKPKRGRHGNKIRFPVTASRRTENKVGINGTNGGTA